jgi:hypothetical protein
MSYPTLWSRAAPFALLSVVTSLALNRALFARARAEEAQAHLNRVAFLRSLLDSPALLTREPAEELRLARQARAAGVEPTSIALPAVEGVPMLQHEVTWSEILWGKEGVAKESILKAAGRVRDRLKGNAPQIDSTASDDGSAAKWNKGESKVKAKGASVELQADAALRSASVAFDANVPRLLR